MRLVVGEVIDREKVVAVVIVGDGKYDVEYVLKPLAVRFNGHDKILLLPQIRLKEFAGKPIGGIGLRKAVEAASTVIGMFRKDIIIVVDLEHVQNEDIKQILKEFFEAGKFNIVEKVFEARVRRGPYEANLFIVCMGCSEKLSIECNEAILIRDVLNVNVKADKKAIRKVLKDHGFRLSDLIIKAEMRILNTAFGNAIYVLNRFDS